MKLPSPRTVLIILGIVAALGLLLAVRGCGTAGTRAKLATGQAGAAIGSARDTVQTIGNQIAAETHIDDITKENEHEIRAAPGANAPVNPAARDAGLRALCKRASYRGDPKCVQFAPPR
jgi:Flp pilus assembly protein TadD